MPRMKESSGFGLDHAFKFFRKKYKETPVAKDITRELYRSVCKDFNKALVNEVIKGKRMQIPHRLGHLWFKKYQIDYANPPTDWAETRKVGKKVPHLNFDTDGYAGRWKWDRRAQDVRNLIYYSFVIAADNQKRINKEFYKPDGHKRYFS